MIPGVRAALGLAALATAMAVPAQPSERGFYAGGSLGQARAKQWCSPELSPGVALTACDDKDSAWKLFAGYQFNQHLALEAARLKLGDVGATVSIGGTPVAVTAAQQSWSIAALGLLPVGRQLSVFGKLGYAESDQEAIASAGALEVKLGEDGTEVLLGFGALWRLSQRWALRAEWERLRKSRIELLSAGVQFHF